MKNIVMKFNNCMIKFFKSKKNPIDLNVQQTI